MENTLSTIEKKPEVQTLSKNAASSLKYAEKIEISSEKDRDGATAAVVKIRQAEQDGDKMRKFFTDPLNEQVKKINGLFMPTIKILNQAQTIIREKLGAYQAAEEKKAADAAAKVEADLAKGKIKNVETAVKKLDKIVIPDKTQRTAAATTTYRDVPEVKIVDRDAFIKFAYENGDWDYFILDENKIKKVATAGVNLPGVKVEIKKVPSFRANG